MKKKIIGILVCVILIITSIPITGQVLYNNDIKKSDEQFPSSNGISWLKTFGGSKLDYCYDVKQTIDGGYIIVGRTESYGFSKEFEIWLIKTDENGNKEWDNTYGGPYNDSGYGVIQTNDGGYLILGSYNDKIFGYDGWLIKTDYKGYVEWDKIFEDRVYKCIQQSDDEEFILAGGKYLTKVDKNGNEIWTNELIDIDKFRIESIKQTKDRGYIVTGGYNSAGNYFDAYLIKTDSEGNKEWVKKIGSDIIGCDVIQRSDDGYNVIGISEEDSLIYHGQGFMIITDEFGDILTHKIYTGVFKNYNPYSIYPITDGGYILTGCSHGKFRLYGLVWLAKTDISGKIIWEKTFCLKNWCNWGNAIQQTTDGGFVIGGTTASYGAGQLDMIVIKTDSNGDVQTTRSYIGNHPSLKPYLLRYLDMFPVLQRILGFYKIRLLI